MRNYQVHVKIKNKPFAHYEFKWEGEHLRSGVQEIDILVNAEEEADAALGILKTSENTLEVVNMVDVTPKVENPHQTQDSDIDELINPMRDLNPLDHADEYVHSCIPVNPAKILQRITISVGNN